MSDEEQTRPVNELLASLREEYEEQTRKEREERRERVQLLPGFTSVLVSFTAFSGHGSVQFYECNLCAALVQPFKAKQERHQERCLP